jgi:hypothetical protein
MPRYFTVEEANAALAVIGPLVERLLQIRQAIRERQPEVWPVIEKAYGNGGSKIASQVEREFERLNDLARQIRSLGAIVKDLNTGLVDFPSLREGREVYLCWQYGEAHVEYWHEKEAGFSGRQRI